VEGISCYDLITINHDLRAYHGCSNVTLFATITEAYLEKLDDPKLNRENLLKEKGRRS
jgi:hypothetical protein